jgi:hypothetical protein
VEGIKKTKHTSFTKGAAHDTNKQKTFTRQLPALCDNCVLTQAVTTDVNKQYTAARPLFPAAAKRIFLLRILTQFPVHYRTV